MTKKIFGYIAIVIGGLLAIILLAQVGNFFTTLFAFMDAKGPEAVAIGGGFILGLLTSWGIQVLLVVLLLRYGIKWVKKDNVLEDEG